MYVDQLALSFDANRAERARRRGMRQVLDSADFWWRAAVEMAIVELAYRGQVFTADQVRQMAGDPPASTHPNALGAIMAGAAKRGLIRMVGYAHSERVIGHGNLVRQWTGGKVGASP